MISVAQDSEEQLKCTMVSIISKISQIGQFSKSKLKFSSLSEKALELLSCFDFINNAAQSAGGTETFVLADNETRFFTILVTTPTLAVK